MRRELSGAVHLGISAFVEHFFFVYKNLLQVLIASLSGQTKYTVTQISEEKAK